MGQVTIYLDAETERKLNQIIKGTKKSKSKWISDLIREKTISEWPECIIQSAGSWDDFPTANNIRESMGKDVKRETF